MGRTQIVYHGTTAWKAKQILNQGFNPDTWFAIHLEDAIGYGGVWVFEVAVPSYGIPKDNWQFHMEARVPPEFVVRLSQYKPGKVKYDNMVLRHMVCISGQTKQEVKRTQSHMRTNPTDYTKDELIAYGIIKS